MNRAGEIRTYLASDRDTAVAETYRASRRDAISVGAFDLIRAASVLDLTATSLVLPSIFDLDLQHVRTSVRFLARFAGEISKPVRPGATRKYVPTQLVTDHFRTGAGGVGPIDGILYPSSKSLGTDVVLFADSKGAIAAGQRRRRPNWLRFQPSTVRVVLHAEAAAIVRPSIRTLPLVQV